MLVLNSVGTVHDVACPNPGTNTYCSRTAFFTATCKSPWGLMGEFLGSNARHNWFIIVALIVGFFCGRAAPDHKKIEGTNMGFKMTHSVIFRLLFVACIIEVAGLVYYGPVGYPDASAPVMETLGVLAVRLWYHMVGLVRFVWFLSRGSCVHCLYHLL